MAWKNKGYFWQGGLRTAISCRIFFGDLQELVKLLFIWSRNSLHPDLLGGKEIDQAKSQPMPAV